MKRSLIQLVGLLSIALSTRLLLAADQPGGPQARLSWSPDGGVRVSVPSLRLDAMLDGGPGNRGPVLVFPKEKLRRPLTAATLQRQTDRELVLHTGSPDWPRSRSRCCAGSRLPNGPARRS